MAVDSDFARTDGHRSGVSRDGRFGDFLRQTQIRFVLVTLRFVPSRAVVVFGSFGLEKLEMVSAGLTERCARFVASSSVR
jgi:hypothetical protein